jgi:hypothetical protein
MSINSKNYGAKRLPLAPSNVKEAKKVSPVKSNNLDAEDDFTHSFMPDLGTDVNAEMDKVINAPLEPSKGFRSSDSESHQKGITMTVDAPVGPGKAISTAPNATVSDSRVTREAEKAGLRSDVVKTGPGRPISGLAYQGKNAVVPERPVATQKRSSRINKWMEEYSPFQRDFHDLMDLNAEISMVSRGMMEVERIYGEFAAYERELASHYEQVKSRAMVEVTGSTEKTRTAYAEIIVEGLRMELEDIRLEVLRSERSQRMLARHLEALTVISNNMRAGFKII